MAVTSAQAQLVALFNAVNGSVPNALVVADVTFGAVSAYTPADGGDTRNTKLIITAAAESANFIGEKELHYIRLDVADGIGDKTITADQADWDEDSEVLAKVNADFQVTHPDDEFALSDLTITRSDGTGTDKIIAVAIKDGHIKFLGNSLAQYTIKQEVTKTDLSTTNGELDGFTIQ
ncbi:hypothetical protein pEaSNUABM29_00277 [Erwinia phage pEa_SNUABM_29]|nr:hypothetical protein pEaSNUABM29_00277 [Erwinia phage pEa_SNUABM_29]